jgi:predicted  nucleic acid-binding Zn-ribbon protein
VSEKKVQDMSEERFLKLEQKIENHDKDLYSIAQSLEGINGHLERTNQILQDFALKDEQFNSKVNRCEDRLTSAIEANIGTARRAHERIDKIDLIIGKVAWTVITIVLVGVVGASVKFAG